MNFGPIQQQTAPYSERPQIPTMGGGSTGQTFGIQSPAQGTGMGLKTPAAPTLGASGSASAFTPTGTIQGAVQGGASAGPPGAVAGAAVGAISDIIKGLFTYYGMKKQIAENRRVEKINLAQYSEQRDEAKKANAWDRHWKERQYKDQKELEKYTKVMNFMGTLKQQLAQKPQLGTNLVNMWNARR